jgi:hypothetical protein
MLVIIARVPKAELSTAPSTMRSIFVCAGVARLASVTTEILLFLHGPVASIGQHEARDYQTSVNEIIKCSPQFGLVLAERILAADRTKLSHKAEHLHFIGRHGGC